jgi:hypothetical protein
MHLLIRPDNGIERARFKTATTTGTTGFIDDRN